MNDNSKDNKHCLLFCRKDAFFDTEYPIHEEDAKALAEKAGYTVALTITELQKRDPVRAHLRREDVLVCFQPGKQRSHDHLLQSVHIREEPRCAAHIYLELLKLNVDVQCAHAVGQS